MKKAGEVAGSGLYKVVVDVASETAKEAVYGLKVDVLRYPLGIEPARRFQANFPVFPIA